MSNAMTTRKTKFFRKISGSWVAVAEVVDVAGPGFKRDVTEVTHLDSPDGYKEYKGANREAGDFTLAMNYVPSDPNQNQSTGFMADFHSDDEQDYCVQYPDLSGYEFKGLITANEITAKNNDKVSANVGIKVTGKPVPFTNQAH